MKSTTYTHPEYVAFVKAMRAAPDDITIPLVVADWLDENGKPEHAKYVRDCCERQTAGECLSSIVHNDLHKVLRKNLHTWTAGAVRYGQQSWWRGIADKTPYGFFREWSFDSLGPNEFRKLIALLARQPIWKVRLKTLPLFRYVANTDDQLEFGLYDDPEGTTVPMADVDGPNAKFPDGTEYSIAILHLRFPGVTFAQNSSG